MIKADKKGGTVLRCALLLTVILLMLSLTACKSKEPVTAEAFRDKLTELGYTVSDITDDYSEFSHIIKALAYEGGGVHVEFLEIDNDENATAVFYGNEAQVKAYKSGLSGETSVSAGNYQKYTLKTGDKYYLIERISNTFIYSYSDKTEEKRLDNIIKALGY